MHEFVVAEGLTCLIKVGAEADQNYQNYILRGASTAPRNSRHTFLFLRPQFTARADRGCYSSLLSHVSLHKPIRDHMCLHTCKLMILPDDPLTFMRSRHINKLQCVPQIMWKAGQVEQLVNSSAPYREGERLSVWSSGRGGVFSNTRGPNGS